MVKNKAKFVSFIASNFVLFQSVEILLRGTVRGVPHLFSVTQADSPMFQMLCEAAAQAVHAQRVNGVMSTQCRTAWLSTEP